MNRIVSFANRDVSAVLARSILCATVALLLLSAPAFAQLNLGRIFGTVTDQTGGVLIGATVTVVDVARNISRPLTAGSAGEFNAPGLTPGTYTVRVEARGFQAVQRENIQVGVGQEVRVDLTLQPGEQTQTVTVTEELPLINTSSATLGGTIEPQQLAELPVNGRAFVKLLDLVPGSATINGNDFNVNGAFSGGNVWMFDGIDEFNPFGTGPVVGGTSGFTSATIMPMDAINQVNIQTNPKAEYGWKVGAVVNTGVKSGGNDIHGTAFAMGRDTVFDARNPFLTVAQGRSSDELKQYGATIGGPISKNRIFYFAGYEGQRYTVAVPGNSQRPTAVPGLGTKLSIPEAIAAINVVNPALLSQLSAQLAGCNFSNPNIHSTVSATVATTCAAATAGAGALPGVGNSGIFFNGTSSNSVPVAYPLTGGSDNGVIKIDVHVNDHNSLNGEYFNGHGSSNQANSPTSTAAAWWLTAKATAIGLGRAVWIYTPNSNWVNEARFGVTRYIASGSSAECGQNLGQPDYTADYGFVPVAAPKPYCGFPQLSVSGFTILGTNETSGGPSDMRWTDFAGIEAVSYTRGKHLTKFGFETHRSILNGTTKLNYIHGRLTFGQVAAFNKATALEDFLTGTVGTSAVLVGSGAIPGYSNMHMNRYALFGQDDWQVSPRVTLNLGMRWEVTPAPSAPAGQFGNWDPNVGLTQLGSNISSLYPTSWTQFQPRLGMAWDISGKGTTVLRAGGSLINEYEPPNAYLSATQGAAVNIIPTGWALFDASGNRLPSFGTLLNGNLSPPTNALSWKPNTAIFPTNPSLLSCGNGLVPVVLANIAFTPSPCNIQPISKDWKNGYIITYTAGIQHAISNKVSITVSYVGTRGLGLPMKQDINQPALGPANTKANPVLEQLRRPYYNQFPYLGQIYAYTVGGFSRYNGLQTSLNARTYHGLSFSANYTYAKSTGNVSADYGTYLMHNENPALDKGPTNSDFRHQFHLTATYAIPGIKAPLQLLEGWEVNSILSVLSATPWDVHDSTDPSGTGIGLDRWTVLGDPSKLESGMNSGAIPCFGIKGSAFDTAPCATVANVAALPGPCQAAAAGEPSGVNTGLQQLAAMGCYFQNGTALVSPALGTFGTMPKNSMRTGTPFREWDGSITKAWKIKERYTTQFRAEVYNITNKPILDLPNSDPSSPSNFGQTTQLNNSGDPILGTGGPRQWDLALKILF